MADRAERVKALEDFKAGRRSASHYVGDDLFRRRGHHHRPAERVPFDTGNRVVILLGHLPQKTLLPRRVRSAQKTLLSCAPLRNKLEFSARVLI